MNFVVLPLADLRDARVTVSDIGPVPAENIDVRHVRFLRARPNYTVRYRYRVVPDVLERFQSLDLTAGENARFWLTVHVPDDAPAGTYPGKVTFECSGGQAELPVTLRILPFSLRDDPGKLFGIYYRHPYDLVASADDDVSRDYFRRRAELEYADMVAHGTRNVVLSCGSSAADAQGKFQFRWDLLADQMELGRKHGFRGPIVMHISTEAVYAKYVKERYGSHLRGVQDPPEEFGRELTALVKAIEAERRQRGWPEFLYYPVDEPSTDQAAVNFMVKVLKASKAAGVRTYVTADPTHEQFEPLRPYVDVWCTQPFAPDRETIQADMQARGVEYWCYPNHVNGENDHTPVAGARMTYGFGFWRSGFLTLIPWIYSSSTGDPFNYLDGASMDFFNRREPDGTPIPVAMWEAYREGYDDYRYIYTLEQPSPPPGSGRTPRVSKRRRRPSANCNSRGMRSASSQIQVRRPLVAGRVRRLPLAGRAADPRAAGSDVEIDERIFAVLRSSLLVDCPGSRYLIRFALSLSFAEFKMSRWNYCVLAGAVLVLVSLCTLAGIAGDEARSVADQVRGRQGQGQSREETAAGRFHRLGLVRLVHQAEARGVRSGSTSRRKPPSSSSWSSWIFRARRNCPRNSRRRTTSSPKQYKVAGLPHHSGVGRRRPIDRPHRLSPRRTGGIRQASRGIRLRLTRPSSGCCTANWTASRDSIAPSCWTS